MSSGNRQHDEQQNDPWEACAPGELTKMVHRLDASQRRSSRKQVYRTALISSAVFACVVFALGSIMGSGSSQYGGISCSYCRGHLAEYYPHASGQLDHQDAAFVTSMMTHLEKCTFCRSKFNSMYPDLALRNATTTRPLVVSAMRPMFAVGRLPGF